MQRHCFLPSIAKKGPPVVWPDQPWHPKIHPSPGSTAALATSSEHLPGHGDYLGFGFLLPEIFLFHVVQSTAPGCEI